MRNAFLVVWMLVLVASAAFGQAGTATISGRVTDPSKASIPNASITATESSRGLKINSVSNSKGEYQILNAPPGTYNITAAAPGFKTLLREDIELQVDDRLTLDLALQVGQVHETITVTAEAPLLRTEDAQTGEVINSLMIENLPQIDRDPMELLRLSGDVAGSGAVAGGYGPNGDSTIDTRINGGRMHSTEYNVDGLNANTGTGHGVVNAAIPTMESVAEFKVITNGLAAEYGHTSGGLVEVVSKGGTNGLHGQLFEYFKNDVMNANDWLDGVLGNPKEKFHNNDFGFDVGGPIIIPKIYNGKNKSFFFFNYEGVRYSVGGATQYASVPTAAERGMCVNPNCPVPANGVANPSGVPLSQVGTYDADLTNLTVGTPCAASAPALTPCSQSLLAYDPLGAITSTSAGLTKTSLLGGDGMHVPSARFDPFISELLDPQFTPLPNVAPPLSQYDPSLPYPGEELYNNFEGRQNYKNGNNQWNVRLDQNISDSKRLYFRFSRYNSYNDSTGWFTPLAPQDNTNTNGGMSGSLHYDWSLSPTFIMDFRAGVNYAPWKTFPAFPSNFSNANFSFDPITRASVAPNSWDYAISDQAGNSSNNSSWWGGMGLGTPANGGYLFPSANAGTSSDFAINLTKIINKHSIKLGAETRRFYDNQYSLAESYQEYDGGYVAQANYGDPSSLLGNNPACNSNMASGVYAQCSQQETWQFQANSYASMLLGYPVGGSTNGPWNFARNNNYYALYIQDDFKVTPRLTINYGLRWDMETPITDRQNNTFFFDEKANPWPGLSLVPNTGQSTWSWNQTLLDAGLTSQQIALLPVPSWVNNVGAPGNPNGLPPGAVTVATSDHRSWVNYHANNFSPRLGLAYQFGHETVLRASVGRMFLTTNGSFQNFMPGNNVASAILNDQGYASRDPVTGNYIYNTQNLYAPGSYYPHLLNDTQANQLEHNGMTTTSNHMPDEWNWSFGLQHEFKWGIVAEANYVGNHSSTLMVVDDASDIPKSLVQPQYASLLATQVANPWGNEVIPSGNQMSSPTEPLGVLYMHYPQYGQINLYGKNAGTNNYNGLVLRFEHRLSKGFAFLVNYTYSKDLDDVGSPDYNGGGPGGQAKVRQTGWDYNDTYGISPLDRTHRLTFYHDIQLPVGAGRHWLGHPGTFGSKALDRVIGGWEYAGIWTYLSGTPLTFTVNNQGLFSDAGVSSLFGSFVGDGSPSDITGPGFKSNSSLLFNPNSNIADVTVRRFDATKFLDVSVMQYGNIPPTYGAIRNPANWTYDASIMKNFYFSGEHSRYMQLRLEGQNFLNHPGLAGYDTTTTDSTFGLITNVANGPRNGQISLRVFF